MERLEDCDTIKLLRIIRDCYEQLINKHESTEVKRYFTNKYNIADKEYYQFISIARKMDKENAIHS